MWPCSLKSSKFWPPPFRPCWTGGANARPTKRKPKLRLAGLLCATILLTPGCASLTARQAPTPLIRPELTSLAGTPDGGIILNKRDAAELLIYIEALELAVGVLK